MWEPLPGPMKFTPSCAERRRFSFQCVFPSFAKTTQWRRIKKHNSSESCMCHETNLPHRSPSQERGKLITKPSTWSSCWGPRSRGTAFSTLPYWETKTIADGFDLSSASSNEQISVAVTFMVVNRQSLKVKKLAFTYLKVLSNTLDLKPAMTRGLICWLDSAMRMSSAILDLNAFADMRREKKGNDEKFLVSSRSDKHRKKLWRRTISM